MARIRTIKPEFWTSESVVECSCSARLLLIGMLNFADDYGNLVDSPKRIKMQIFPADNIDVAPLLGELISNGLVIPYSINGEKYLNIKGFRKHQVINKPSKSKIPLPIFDENKNNSTTPVDEGYGSITTPVDEGYFTEGNGREWKGMELNNKNNASEDFSFANIDTKGTQEEQPRIFKMYVGWTPEPKSWEQTLKASQHLTKNKPFTDYNLAEFIRRNVDGQEKTESNWQKYYVNAFAKGMLNEERSTEKPQTTFKQKQPEITPPVYKNWSLEPDEPLKPKITREQLAEMRRIVDGEK